MDKPQFPIKPEQIIEIILRRRWLIIIPFCLSIIAGIYFSITLPRVYEANTLILVEPQRVPSNFVQSIVSTDINERINTIQQQILSRTNLEKIIGDFRLFEGPEYIHMFLEDKLENLRKRISVRVTRSRSGGDAFSISFTGEDPDKVMKIVNTLASFFIDENLKVREAQAIGTSDFLDGELESMRLRLEETEGAMEEYRKKYMGELPEQLTSNLSILTRLSEQLESQKSSLREAKNNLLELESNLRRSQSTSESQNEFGDLDEMRARLSRLQSIYTERHPDIIRLKKAIADFEEKIQKDAKEASKSSTGSSSSERGVILSSPDAARKRELQLEIQTLEMEISKNLQQLDLYQKRVENSPKREQELLSLKRDYQNIQQSYNSLLARKLEAEIAVNMERKQKGEQFRIIDPAKLPEKPVSPDLKKIFILALAAGLGLGGGIIFLLEIMDTSFKEAEDAEAYLGIPVLATIPLILHPEDIKKKRINLIFSSIFIGVAFFLLAGFGVLLLKGVDPTIEIVRKFVKI